MMREYESVGTEKRDRERDRVKRRTISRIVDYGKRKGLLERGREEGVE